MIDSSHFALADQSYFSTRASLPVTIHALLKQVEREAGLIGTVMFAGPDIKQGGNIYSMV